MQKKKSHSKRPKAVSASGIFVWILAILFYFYEFFLGVLPATIAENLIDSLHISLEEFAIIGSGYFITYSLMQIPVGLLLDKFRVKLLLTLAASCCSLGTLWFYFVQGFSVAFISRLLIGVGSSFGFIGLMIVTLNCFPKRYFAFMLGCGQLIGILGPICSAGPIAFAMRATNNNWRLIFLICSLFGILLTILIGMFLDGKTKSNAEIIIVDKKAPLIKRIQSLTENKQIWGIMLYGGLIYVSIPLLGAFWGTSYLEARAFSKITASILNSMIWVGMAISCPLVGKISDRLKRRKPVTLMCAFIGLISASLLLFTPYDNPYYLALLFFCIGFAGGGQSLSFVFMSENAPKNLRATALGLNNTAVMGFTALLPPILTSIMQFLTGTNPISIDTFNQVLIAIPIAFTLAFLVSLFTLKETFCRQQNTVHKVSFS